MRLTVLPAGDGDCLILSYGDPVRHLIVDGGRRATYARLRPRLELMARRGEILELLVVSHFDADHIEGILRLASDPDLPLAPRGVWFNGFDQLSSLQSMNERQADELTERLSGLNWPVNVHFGGTACLPRDGSPPTALLEGGLEVTLLSPDRGRLGRLRARWDRWRNWQDEPEAGPKYLQDMGRRRRVPPERVDLDALLRVPEDADTEVPNGSSIAFVARWAGRSVLLAADAHPDLLERSVARLLPEGCDRLQVDVMKLSHHGSGRNTTVGLLRKLDCSRFVLSTDGSRHQHPDPEAVARVLAHSPGPDRALYFNYRQPWTEFWDDPKLRARHGFRCVFPDGEEALAIDV